MRNAVVDASALVRVLVNADSAAIRHVLAESHLHAPHLIDLEVLSAIRRIESLGADEAESSATLSAFRAYPMTRHNHGPFLERIWELRHNVSPYDAAYVALAEAPEVPLITRDLRLRRAAEGLLEVISGERRVRTGPSQPQTPVR